MNIAGGGRQGQTKKTQQGLICPQKYEMGGSIS